MAEEEEWRDVVGYEGAYEVSSRGRIRNTRTGLVLKERINAFGYNRMRLSKNGVHKDIQAHRIVCEAFVGPRPEGLIVNHINNVRSDNRPENLEWVTHQQNTAHCKNFGTYPALEANGRAKLDREQVRLIRERKANGASAKELAATHGVSKDLIHKIVAREVWATV